MAGKKIPFLSTLNSEFLYLDTSFIQNIIKFIPFPAQQHSVDCQTFFNTLRTNISQGKLHIVTSDFAVNEACFNIIRFYYQKNMPFTDTAKSLVYSDRSKWQREFYKNRPEFIETFENKIDEFFDFIENTPILILNSDYFFHDKKETLHKQVQYFIKKYYLLPTDAYHIAIGNASGVTDFVSLDGDWVRTTNNWNEKEDFNLYTCI